MKNSLTEAYIIIKSINNIPKIIGNDSASLGYKYISNGNEQGVYIDWSFDGTTLTLKADRYGFYPCYYFLTDNAIGISTSIDVLLKHVTPELDDAAIAVFLRLGYFVGNDTPFKEIYSLPPGACLTWTAEHGVKWDNQPPPLPSKTHLSYKEAVKHYGELFQQAISNYFDQAHIDKNNIVLPLSGGRDSRHILFALLKQGIKPKTSVTILHQPPRSNEDARIASLICQELALNHSILNQNDKFITAEIEKNKITNFCCIEHGWLLPLRNYFSIHTHSLILDGIGADVLTESTNINQKQIELSNNKQYNELAKSILGSESWLLPNYLGTKIYKKFSRKKAKNRIITCLKKQTDKPFPLTQFFFWNRTRRTIAQSPYSLLNLGVPVYAPFLDHKIFDFLSTLPSDFVMKHIFNDSSFRLNTINQYYPENTHFPYENKSAQSTEWSRSVHTKELLALMLYFANTSFHSRYINHRYILPRLLKSIFTKPDSQHIRELTQYPIWLTQLEQLIHQTSN